jgi:hypothetical protein
LQGVVKDSQELPNNKAELHEITVDLDGNAWVTQRVGGKLGRLDGKNLTYSEIAPPAGPSPTNRLNAIPRPRMLDRIQSRAIRKIRRSGSASSTSTRLHDSIPRQRDSSSFHSRTLNPIRAVSKSIRPIRTGSGGRVISPGGWDTLNW